MSDLHLTNGAADARNGSDSPFSGDPGPLETLCFDIYQDLRARLDLPHSTCTAAMHIVLAHIYDYEIPLDKRRLERIVKHDLQASQNCPALLHRSTDAERAASLANKIADMQANRVHEADEWSIAFEQLYSLCEKMNPFWLQQILLGGDDDVHLLRNLVDFRIHIPLWNVPGCEYLCYTWCRILRSLIEQQQQFLESSALLSMDSEHRQTRQHEAQGAIQLVCDKLVSYSVTNEIMNDINTLAYRHFSVCRVRRPASASNHRLVNDVIAQQRCESRSSGSAGRPSSRLLLAAESGQHHPPQTSVMPNMQLYAELLKLALAIYSVDLPASSRVFYALEEWNAEIVENLLNDAQCLATGVAPEASVMPRDDTNSSSWRDLAERIYVLLIAVHDKASLDDEYEFPLSDHASSSVVMDALSAAAAHAHTQFVVQATNSKVDATNDERDDAFSSAARKRDSLASDDVYIPDGDTSIISLSCADEKLSSSEFGAVLLNWFNRRYNLRQHHVACNGWLKLCRFLINLALQPWITYVIHPNDLPVFIDLCKRHVRNNPIGHRDRIACLKILRNLHRNLSSSSNNVAANDGDEVLSKCVRKIVKFFAWLEALRETTKDSPSSTEIDITQSIITAAVPVISSTSAPVTDAGQAGNTETATSLSKLTPGNNADSQLLSVMRTTSV